ncbi:hypothetical protein DBY21_10250 [Candidatus Gastranaerophilales bacterium]|nr:MAG: hypothetical protein DBY21_10250 [Candidatus Gastranaerophilales bacterium]
MQINSISAQNSNNNTRPAFGAKIGTVLKFMVKEDPRLETFMKNFSKWGDSNTVVDVYNAQIGGKTQYMLRLKNNVLDGTTVPVNKEKPEFMKKNLINPFFNLTERDINWAEYSLFKRVKDFARSGGKPYLERLSNIIRSHKQEGIVFDAASAKIFNEI